MGITFNIDDLCACLLLVAPVELKGMGLLREQPHLISGAGNIPRDALVETVTEIVEYTGRCAAAAHHLSNLAPVPLLNAMVMEFGL